MNEREPSRRQRGLKPTIPSTTTGIVSNPVPENNDNNSNQRLPGKPITSNQHEAKPIPDAQPGIHQFFSPPEGTVPSPYSNQSYVQSSSANSTNTSIYVDSTPQMNNQNNTNMNNRPPTFHPGYGHHSPYPSFNHQQQQQNNNMPPYVSGYPPMTPNHFVMQQMQQLQQSMQTEHDNKVAALERKFEDRLAMTAAAISKSVAAAITSTRLGNPPVQEISYNSMAASLPEATLSSASTRNTGSEYTDHTASVKTPSTHQSDHTTKTNKTNSSAAEIGKVLESLIQTKEPMKFQTLMKDTDVTGWIATQALRCNKHLKYQSLTIRNASGVVQFKDNLTNDESENLYLLLTNSLGKMADKIITNPLAPDGLTLLAQIKSVYPNSSKDTSVSNQELLLNEFNELQRESKEDYLTFAVRFNRKTKQLEENEVLYNKAPMALAYKFLRGLGEKRLNENIVLELEHKPDWFQNKTILEIANKALRYMKAYKALPTSIEPKKVEPPRPKIDKINKDKANDGGWQKVPYRNKDKETEDDEKSKKELMESKITTLTESLKKVSDLKPYLSKLKKNDPVKFKSFAMKQACTRAGAWDVYSLVSQPPPSTPTAAAPPVAARRVTNDNVGAMEALTSTMTKQFETLMNRMDRDIAEGGHNEDTTHSEQDNDNNSQSQSYLLNLFNYSPPVATHTIPTFAQLEQFVITYISQLSNFCKKYADYKLSRRSKQQASQTTVVHKTTTHKHKPSTTSIAVADSGATDTMTGDKSLFENISYYDNPSSVVLGDETTCHPIEGYGWITFTAQNRTMKIKALYVPALGKSTLFSIKQHIQWKGTFFHAEAKSALLAFPTFVLNLDVNHEIQFSLEHLNNHKEPYDFDESIAHPATISPNHATIPLISSSIKQYIPHAADHQPFNTSVQIQKLSPLARIPTRATKGSIGFDVYAQQDVTIAPGQIVKISTGLAVAMPDNMYLRIAPRSSLASNHITVEGGVVDPDYRGDIKVMLKNHNATPITILAHDSMAQFIFEHAHVPFLQTTNSLPTSNRGTGNFGSTNTTNRTPLPRFEEFRLNDKYVLQLDNRNPFRPRAKRISRPVINPIITPDATPVPLQPIEIPTNQNKGGGQTPTIPTIPPKCNPITVHLLDENEETAVDNCLDMSIEDIPTPAPTAIPTNIVLPVAIPSPLPVDQVNHSLPATVVMSQDALHRAIGFRSITTLMKQMNKLGTKNVQIQNLPQTESIDDGAMASLHSSRRNTTPSVPPKSYSDIWHMDIGYGPCTAIGGVKYTLILIDKFSRYKFVYGIKNLTSSLLEAIKKFVRDAGIHPKLIRTDFDHKLMGGNVAAHLLDNNIKVESAPPYRQHQNGLIERHWQTIVNMARNWLKSSMLPSTYWFFAVKRATEVSNIMPLKRDDKYFTPYEAVYQKKVDYRVLFPMFSIAYIRQHREDGQDKNSWVSKSLKCIAVGTCNKSDSLLFYHPPSKQTLSCGDGYRFDTYSPAGPHFDQQYDGDFIFNTKSALSVIHRPPTHDENATVYYEDDGCYHKATILNIPIKDDTEPYTVQDNTTGDIKQLLAEDLHDHDPSSDPSISVSINASRPFPQIPWAHHESKATLYLPHFMKKPKQGFLLHDPLTTKWTFHPGRTTTNKQSPIDLPNFDTLIESMVENKKIFKGWVRADKVITARRVRATSNILAHVIIAKKVSAANLHSMKAPTLLKHYQLHPEDKKTWDAAYLDEYKGLTDIDTWEEITEEDYENSKHLFGNLLPTMAISTIKYDGNGKPTRAKYRIVALGNLDPHDWSKNECFAPVLSQMELRLLTALATRNKCVPKTGDITQAFCQSYLPKGEDYVCRPPPGCPITKRNTYLKLKKTLYGLKRSPKHFYDLARKTLLSIGLHQHPYSPCIFYGNLIEGEPPLYLGLYVDDFFYFSSSEKVEKKFEKTFSSKLGMELNGEVSYFLGIKFETARHDDDNLSIKLSQEAFIESLAALAHLDGDGVTCPTSPYRAGFPIDKIPNDKGHISDDLQHRQNHLLRTLVGSLNWLALSTRPDIAPITNMLARYCQHAAKGHIHACKRVIKYLKGTKSEGIIFSSTDRADLNAHVKFPISPDTIVSLTDANWGPQDQSVPKPGTTPPELDIFKSRSMSGFLIWLGGPVHWVAKRQSITARSSAEAEIYATDECVKQLIQLSYIIDGLHLIESLMPTPTPIFNDNSACVCWSKSTTTKGLRHIQMRENAIREAVLSDFVSVSHIEGKVNLADMFTKEDKDTAHFILTKEHVMGKSLEHHFN